MNRTRDLVVVPVDTTSSSSSSAHPSSDPEPAARSKRKRLIQPGAPADDVKDDLEDDVPCLKKRISQLESELKLLQAKHNDAESNTHCPVCREPLVSAVCAPCSHVFCGFCLRTAHLGSPDTHVKCPLCRQMIPNGGLMWIARLDAVARDFCGGEDYDKRQAAVYVDAVNKAYDELEVVQVGTSKIDPGIICAVLLATFLIAKDKTKKVDGVADLTALKSVLDEKVIVSFHIQGQPAMSITSNPTVIIRPKPGVGLKVKVTAHIYDLGKKVEFQAWKARKMWCTM
jgi:hypothetical protein